MPPRQPARRSIESDEHRDKQRLDSPPVGLVTPEMDPLELGEHWRIAVKIADDRGIESPKVIDVVQ